MTGRQEKEIKKVANYIFNNLTVSEMFHILAEKSSEIATKVVIEKLETDEYKRILLQKKKKEATLKRNRETLGKIRGWFSGLFTKKAEIPDTPPVKEEQKTIRKINTRRRKVRAKSKGLSTKK
jgi:hypothetical protein